MSKTDSSRAILEQIDECQQKITAASQGRDKSCNPIELRQKRDYLNGVLAKRQKANMVRYILIAFVIVLLLFLAAVFV